MDVRDATKIDQSRDARIDEMRPKEKERPKDQPSEFDRVLESSIRQPTKPMAQTTIQQATEQASREAKQREDRERERRRRDEGEKEQGREQKSHESRRSSGASSEKVVAKGRLSDERGGSGGDGGARQHPGGGMSRRGSVVMLKKAGGKAGPAVLGARFGDQLRTSLRAAAESPRLAQAILNRIVEYVRIGLNRRGEKEMHIDLHERVFRGLKLTVTSRAGKVGVQFQASDAKTRKLFEQNRAAIHDALTAKGIQVDEILVS